MKKFLLIGVIALSSMVNAQVKFGVKGGYNLSNLSVSSPISSAQVLLGNKSGFHAGGFVEYGFGNGFALKGEVLYNLLGARLEIDRNELPVNEFLDISELDVVYGVNNAEARLNINQISIPVSAKYTFNKFSVLGGVDVNFVVGVKSRVELDGAKVVANEVDIDNIIDKQISTANFGLHIGGEYAFTDNLFLDARYNFGISSLNKNFTDIVKLKQRYFQLGIGYKF